MTKTNFGNKIKSSKRTSILMMAIAVISLISISATLSEENSFVALADLNTWTLSGTTVLNAAGTNVQITGNTAVVGDTTLTNGVYWSHFPHSDGNAYVSGNEVVLRDATSITMTVDNEDDEVRVGSSTVPTDLTVIGNTKLVDSTGSYDSHFPAPNSQDAVISGKNIVLRGGGGPGGENWKVTLHVDNVNDIVNVTGDMHFTETSGSKITSAGDICIGSGCP